MAEPRARRAQVVGAASVGLLQTCPRATFATSTRATRCAVFYSAEKTNGEVSPALMPARRDVARWGAFGYHTSKWWGAYGKTSRTPTPETGMNCLGRSKLTCGPRRSTNGRHRRPRATRRRASSSSPTAAPSASTRRRRATSSTRPRAPSRSSGARRRRLAPPPALRPLFSPSHAARPLPLPAAQLPPLREGHRR